MMSVLMCPKLGPCCDAGMMLTDEKIEREREKRKNKISILRYLYRKREGNGLWISHG